MLKILLVSFLLAGINALQFANPLKKFMQQSNAAVIRIAIAASLVGSCQSVLAEALEDISADTPAFTMKIAKIDDEEARIKRKIELQKKANGNFNPKSIDGDGNAGDESYIKSLERERNKQGAMKKSKVSRGKDLCEVLGRGC